ncbi:MAG: RNB domain-containing ribonuclease [Myxococcota bacterium]
MKVEGRVRVHARGFGFLEYETEQGSRSAFIPPPELRPFLHGDLVRAKVVRTGRNRFGAADIEFLRRNRTTLFGTIVRRGREVRLRPDRLISNSDWPLEGARDAQGQALGRIRGEVLVFERVVDESEAALERVRARYGLRTEFPEDVLSELPEFKPEAQAQRRDLRALTTLTIDGPKSMDLDDALSALPADETGALRVFVSIADVGALVPAGSALDEEARRRGTSVYLAGGVTPMLPRSLSEDRCSLLPEQTRAAVTVELRIDPEGLVSAVDIYESLIRSDRRLSYEEVASVFEAEGEAAELPEAVADCLGWLRTAASRISATREARGGVRILRAEAKIEMGDDGEPVDFAERAGNEAHDLVERLMVAANEAVARWLVDRGVPAVFRIHPAPSQKQVDALSDSARRSGFRPGFGRQLTPRSLAAFEHQYAQTPSARAMSSILGKILGPARYQTDAGQHFGLGSPTYLHFTSPIRRYADLAVHRMVKAFLQGQRSFDGSKKELEELSERLNDLSRRASKAEAERERMLAARFFNKKLGQRFDGRVVAAKTFGLVVYLFGSGVTATLPDEHLPDGAEYRGDRFDWGSGRLRVGDKVKVEIAEADEELGRIELELRDGPQPMH